MNENIELAREYIRAIESGATGDALAKVFTADLVVREMPNRVAHRGSVSNLCQGPRSRQTRSAIVQKKQTYSITNILGDGDRVALEMDWIGITAVQIQSLSPGSEMRDLAAIFLEFRNGRISRQHTCDCFEPW